MKNKKCNSGFCQTPEYKEPFMRSMPYALSSNWYKKAGRADEKGITEKDVDPKQLAMGIEIEKEHTDDKEMAKQIALDHLAELPDYYTRLKEMEKQGEKETKE